MKRITEYFSKNNLYTIIILSIAWVLLSENISIPVAATGIIISICCVFFSFRFLPIVRTADINLFRLFIYLFYLMGQVYLAAFNAIRLIFKGAEVNVIEVKTQISENFLRTILAISITLTPGSISLDLKNNTLTVLLLSEKKFNLQDKENAANIIKNSLEKSLLKAER